MLLLPAIVALALASPAESDAVVAEPAATSAPADTAPLDAPDDAPPSSADRLPNRGLAPLSNPGLTESSPPRPSDAMYAPLRVSGETPTATSTDVAAPLARPDIPPPEPPKRRVPAWIEIVRVDVLVGPVWRIRTTEVMSLASVEVGRQRGFSAMVQGGIIVAPDRDIVGVLDFPIGAGFVYRHRFGQRSLYGSVGLTAGLLIHRAATERGLLHRVDPDLQLPLRFAWTVGKVGLSVALLQGFSTRSRTYDRRGIEVWKRIPYRVGFAIGIHFDVGVGRTSKRRSKRAAKGPP